MESLRKGLAGLLTAGALLSTSYDGKSAETNSINEVKRENLDLSYLNVYDNTINKTLKELKTKHGRAPESDLIKAIIAVESGSQKDRKSAFTHDPMQIANTGDFALSILAAGQENTPLIGCFSFLKGKDNTLRVNGKWDYSKSNMTPENSIVGGIGWLFHKAAKYGITNIEDKEVRTYKIKSGDSFAKIAPKLGTTTRSLISRNPDVRPEKLRAGQVINYVKAHTESFISGWKPWETAVRDYNGGGNTNYVRQVFEIKDKLKLQKQLTSK